jgi:hypothetical protein
MWNDCHSPAALLAFTDGGEPHTLPVNPPLIDRATVVHARLLYTETVQNLYLVEALR